MVKILTIEDSGFERTLILKMLHRAGYKGILQAENGAKGIETFKSEKPDLVLLDMRLPIMSGLDVLRKLKEVDANVKVVIVSVVRSPEEKREALSLGAQAYIQKPINEKEFIDAVKQALR